MFFEKKENIFVGRFEDSFNDDNVFLCTSTRKWGGVSKGMFSNLNLGTNTIDDSENVKTNRGIFFSSLQISEKILAVPNQIHSSNIEVISKGGIYPDCDGFITNQRNVCLSIQTADCIPLFLYAKDEKIIGLIHAGWRGTQNGIAVSAVKIMVNYFNVSPKNISAYMGPCIRKCCYKIKEDVASYFPNYYIRNDYLDLPRYIKDELIGIGINRVNIEDSGLCTSCQSHLFYSYRRDNVNAGRMLSLMMLR